MITLEQAKNLNPGDKVYRLLDLNKFPNKLEEWIVVENNEGYIEFKHISDYVAYKISFPFEQFPLMYWQIDKEIHDFYYKDRILELLNLLTFKQWIAGHPDNEVVGKNCDTNSCPIANYLYYHIDEEVNIDVESEHILISNKYGEYYLGLVQLPDWARYFVNLIDHERNKEYTAKECLSLLDVVERMDNEFAGYVT